LRDKLRDMEAKLAAQDHSSRAVKNPTNSTDEEGLTSQQLATKYGLTLGVVKTWVTARKHRQTMKDDTQWGYNGQKKRWYTVTL
jgi:hypothetical protein